MATQTLTQQSISATPVTRRSYVDTAKTAQASVHDAIPAAWRLPENIISAASPGRGGIKVVDIPRTCGLLNKEQLEITEQTATELVARMTAGHLSSVQVTEAFCIRAAVAHQLTNCLTEFFPEEALATAAALDAHLLETGQPMGALHGLPVCIKDMYDVKGHRTTMAFVGWYDNIATQDSAIVRILRAQGAVIHCKTTMPQTGMMLESTSWLWGRTSNPFNTALVPGGSSGGDGALIAMKGSPIAPSSDIGGSIRVPAAYNGLYSLKPSADRIPRGGLKSPAPGNISIKVSCGPQAHSVADVKMFTKVINAYPNAKFEANVVPMPWRELSTPKHKLSFGLWETDGVVQPHPPIRRALRETAQKLIVAGHQVIPIKLPFDCWENLVVTRKLFFQTGAEEVKTILSTAGEPMKPGVKFALETFNTRPLTIKELFACNTQQTKYKAQMAEFWSGTAGNTSTGRPIDAILGPVSAAVGARHDVPGYCGYTSVWNILDYPAGTIPLKNFKVDETKDPKDVGYEPTTFGPYDRMVHEMCKVPKS
ncbi:Acetamidase [Cyphellophora attinorum]|uniref:Acetamidase n=1 Tax=Cyphellophora attinorum TaxID=1664694 RepID=A0A0N1HDK3_9EURO|nr:Acetamidase [Phialophora attinorum]KPI42753.1 Acetamidase [Phialophora attinorum]